MQGTRQEPVELPVPAPASLGVTPRGSAGPTNSSTDAPVSCGEHQPGTLFGFLVPLVHERVLSAHRQGFHVGATDTQCSQDLRQPLGWGDGGVAKWYYVPLPGKPHRAKLSPTGGFPGWDAIDLLEIHDPIWLGGARFLARFGSVLATREWI